MNDNSLWPDLPLAAWSDTCDTLQLWTQIVGKVRIKLTPLINHWWNATLFVTARGLVAPAMPYAGRTLDIAFDFVEHRLVLETSDGRVESFALKPMTVADFYAEFMLRLRRLDIDVRIWTMPGEIENAIPFELDRKHAHYDGARVQKFWRTLLHANRVMNVFRARFVGKASPVHFFWGSFDLTVSRFSGRTAAPPQSVTPNVANWVMAEAYSHEVSSCGFWPGNGGYGRAAFYVYAYPEPKGYGDTPISTVGAFYDKAVGQFILPYDVVRQSADPDAMLLGFLQETYAAAADLAKWDRKALERRPRAK
ncbi:MAG: DUF5996 family protein [Xanthobacteraceae bacterium]